MALLPSASTPRPPAGNVVTVGTEPSNVVTRFVPSGPNPRATGFIVIVAMPYLARAPASRAGNASLLLLPPIPIIATGQPSAGIGPEGIWTLKYAFSVAVPGGTPTSVPTTLKVASDLRKLGAATRP